MSDSPVKNIEKSVEHAFQNAERFDAPYQHWTLNNLFPSEIADMLPSIEFPIQDLGGVSGKRELHNDTRHYVDTKNRRQFKSFALIADTFQSTSMAQTIEKFTGADLNDTFLRIEYAQDVEGFWLEPHTDLGVKRLTVLIYLASNTDNNDLGTDIFDSEKKDFKRATLEHNAAMMFVPSDNTYHGFNERKFTGVRKSLILNYVTKDWRDREQLAFPDQTVRTN